MSKFTSPIPSRKAIEQGDWPDSAFHVRPGCATKSVFYADENPEYVQHWAAERLESDEYSPLTCLLTRQKLSLGTPYVLVRRDTGEAVRFVLYGNGRFLDFDGWHSRADVMDANPDCTWLRSDWGNVALAVRGLGLEAGEYSALKRQLGEYIDTVGSNWAAKADRGFQDSRPVTPVGAIGAAALFAIVEGWKGLKLRRVVLAG